MLCTSSLQIWVYNKTHQRVEGNIRTSQFFIRIFVFSKVYKHPCTERVLIYFKKIYACMQIIKLHIFIFCQQGQETLANTALDDPYASSSLKYLWSEWLGFYIGSKFCVCEFAELHGTPQLRADFLSTRYLVSPSRPGSPHRLGLGPPPWYCPQPHYRAQQTSGAPVRVCQRNKSLFQEIFICFEKRVQEKLVFDPHTQIDIYLNLLVAESIFF